MCHDLIVAFSLQRRTEIAPKAIENVSDFPFRGELLKDFLKSGLIWPIRFLFALKLIEFLDGKPPSFSAQIVLMIHRRTLLVKWLIEAIVTQNHDSKLIPPLEKL